MRIPRKLATAVATAAIASLAFGSVASAATLSFAPFGNASLIPGGANIVSDTAAADAYGGIDFNLPVAVPFGALTVLRTAWAINAGDCGGGSPRFQLNIDADADGSYDGSLFVYVGPVPSFSGCAAAGDTGNMVGTTDLRVDSTQLGGAFYGTWADAVTAIGPAAKLIGVQLVVDSGWIATQDFDVFPTVEVTLPSPANKNECKKGGWEGLFRANGSAFKNQGDCIQYVNTGK